MDLNRQRFDSQKAANHQEKISSLQPGHTNLAPRNIGDLIENLNIDRAADRDELFRAISFRSCPEARYSMTLESRKLPAIGLVSIEFEALRQTT
jgi:hypothetical protein